jgi:hypothetical protein
MGGGFRQHMSIELCLCCIRCVQTRQIPVVKCMASRMRAKTLGEVASNSKMHVVLPRF